MTIFYSLEGKHIKEYSIICKCSTAFNKNNTLWVLPFLSYLNFNAEYGKPTSDKTRGQLQEQNNARNGQEPEKPLVRMGKGLSPWRMKSPAHLSDTDTALSNTMVREACISLSKPTGWYSCAWGSSRPVVQLVRASSNPHRARTHTGHILESTEGEQHK